MKGRAGGRGYAGSRMNAGPLSRNTLNCLVCAEVAGMVSMITQQEKATFRRVFVIFPHHKLWLNFTPHLRLSFNNNRNQATKISWVFFFPSKFKWFLSAYYVQGAMHVSALSKLFAKSIDLIGGAVCRKN